MGERKSDRGTPVAAPVYTRLKVEGRYYVAVGAWTEDEMRAAILHKTALSPSDPA